MAALIIAVSALAYLTALLFVLGNKTPAYDQIRHTISELGERDAPYQLAVALGVFLPVGLALLLAAYLARPLGDDIAALALCISVGYLVAAAFPCDPGSPLSGTTRQAIHNLGGAVEYVGGGLMLLRIAESFGDVFEIAGFVVLAVALAISLQPLAFVRGLIQRIAELCLFAGLAGAIWMDIQG